MAGATNRVPLQFVPLTPCRVMDTRNPNGPLGGPLISGGTTRTVPVSSSSCGVPANAAAYSVNLTVVPRTGFLGYLTVWPTGQTQPVVSTLNSFDGSIIANAAIVPAGAGGSINAYASNDTDLVMDIDGYFITPGASSLQFYPLAPCRVLDTRNANGTFGGPALTGGASRSFPIASSPCGAPATAAAYSLNVTVVPHGTLGYLTAWPTGQTQPVVSTLNSFDGSILANAAIVPAGTGGAVSFFVTNTTDLVVDIDGYFAPPGTGGLNYYAVTPCRAVDTRNANGPLGGPIMNANTTRSFPLAGECGLPADGGSLLAEHDGGSARPDGVPERLARRGIAACGIDTQRVQGPGGGECGPGARGHEWGDQCLRSEYHPCDYRHERVLSVRPNAKKENRFRKPGVAPA